MFEDTRPIDLIIDYTDFNQNQKLSFYDKEEITRFYLELKFREEPDDYIIELIFAFIKWHNPFSKKNKTAAPLKFG